ncbi:hypothetical protein [Streptomyces cavernae]|uniref:hypothetical protein n=1 Tax=Streptomyces cavernae TaxID=2259034 RepID=UPI000FEC1B6E|nr:hypothetical protein [Streptomyces cavernae]
MPTFTFPSGATVDVPEGLPLCERPDEVTYDCGRFIPVGLARSGKPVFSGFSCAAYCALGSIYDMRQQVEEDRKRASVLQVRGRKWRARNLLLIADDRAARSKRIIASLVADPAPCTCVIPPVRAADLAAELGMSADEVRALVLRTEGRPSMDESVTFRRAADGELVLAHPEVIALRMHYTRQPAS